MKKNGTEKREKKEKTETSERPEDKKRGG